MSADIQNKMLKILLQTILPKLIAAIKDKSQIFQVYSLQEIPSLTATSFP